MRCCFAIPITGFLSLALSGLSGPFAHAADSDDGAVSPGAKLTFERHVRPILKTHCFQCHGEEEEHEGGLDVRLRHFLTKGGDSGPVIVPGKPDESVLIERLRSGEMPPGDDPKKKVPRAEIEIIARWIAAGAVTARAEPDVLIIFFATDTHGFSKISGSATVTSLLPWKR